MAILRQQTHYTIRSDRKEASPLTEGLLVAWPLFFVQPDARRYPYREECVHNHPPKTAGLRHRSHLSRQVMGTTPKLNRNKTSQTHNTQKEEEEEEKRKKEDEDDDETNRAPPSSYSLRVTMRSI